MKNYNTQIQKNLNVSVKQDKILDAAIYIIAIITMVMLCPLIYVFANNYSSSNISVQNNKNSSNGAVSKSRKYTFTENEINISNLINTEYGDLKLVAAKTTDDGTNILFCADSSDVLRIAVVNNNDDFINGTDENRIAIYKFPLKYNLYQSISAKDYVYKDYSDGTFFLSNNKTAFLFDINNIKITSNYNIPPVYHIYQTSLS